MAVLTIAISLDFKEEELADEAVEAGLEGSFLRSRALSNPFSLGEGRGVPRGEAGSYRTPTKIQLHTVTCTKVNNKLKKRSINTDLI